MADDTDSRVQTLLEFYEEQHESNNSEIPSGGVVIGAYGLSGERALIYPVAINDVDMSEDSGLEPTVAVCDFGEVTYTCSLSFRNHLYRQAFKRGWSRGGNLFSLYQNDENLIADVREMISQTDFQFYWFSDEFQVCFERDDGELIYVERTPGRTSTYGSFSGHRKR